MNEQVVEKWVTLKEVQEHLGVGRETILQWIAKRNMPAYKVGRLWKFKFLKWMNGFAPAVLQTTEKMKIKSQISDSSYILISMVLRT